MALPTSGPLSFSAIGAALGAAGSLSIRGMSGIAGFGTPDYVSEFYGFSCPAYGTFLYSTCNGCEESYVYANGTCGTYSTIVNYNSPNCGCGGGLTLFFRNGEVNISDKVCIFQVGCCVPAWHNGTGPLPSVGDIVYDDAAGTIPLENTIGGYFGMSSIECEPPFEWFLIYGKNPGETIETGVCLI